jgi:23S rRNA A2030 N6-methylase RlmJ
MSKEPPPPSPALIAELLRKADLLCARCELLRREAARLTQENTKLRDKNTRAKRELSALLARLPEEQ